MVNPEMSPNFSPGSPPVEDRREQKERTMRSVVFHTVPSRFVNSRFNFKEPYARIREINYSEEKQVLRGFKDISGEKYTPFSFTLPGEMVTRLKSYVSKNFLYEDVNPGDVPGGDHVRNCYHFGTHMAGIDVANAYQAAVELNRRVELQPVDFNDLVPGTLLVIAHPQSYKDYGGIRIDHALVSLDNRMAIQVMGVGGPLGVTTYNYILDNTRKIMLSAPSNIWIDGQPTQPEEIQIHSVHTHKQVIHR